MKRNGFIFFLTILLCCSLMGCQSSLIYDDGTTKVVYSDEPPDEQDLSSGTMYFNLESTMESATYIFRGTILSVKPIDIEYTDTEDPQYESFRTLTRGQKYAILDVEISEIYYGRTEFKTGGVRVFTNYTDDPLQAFKLEPGREYIFMATDYNDASFDPEGTMFKQMKPQEYTDLYLLNRQFCLFPIERETVLIYNEFGIEGTVRMDEEKTRKYEEAMETLKRHHDWIMETEEMSYAITSRVEKGELSRDSQEHSDLVEEWQKERDRLEANIDKANEARDYQNQYLAEKLSLYQDYTVFMEDTPLKRFYEIVGLDVFANRFESFLAQQNKTQTDRAPELDENQPDEGEADPEEAPGLETDQQDEGEKDPEEEIENTNPEDARERGGYP